MSTSDRLGSTARTRPHREGNTVTGMEHAIEQVAVKVAAERRFGYPESSPRARFEIDAFSAGVEWAVGQLREAGLLAPAPLREEWSAAFTGIAPDGTEHIRLIGTEGDREHAQETCDDCNADDPDVLFFLVRSHYTDWLPVDRAEGDERADQ